MDEPTLTDIQRIYTGAGPKKKGLIDLLSETWPAKMAQSAWGAVTLPGDVYQGNVTSNDPSYYNRATDLAGLVMGGGYPMAENGAAGIFGGKLAQTADRAALAKAEKMAAKGANRDDIWNSTGWFQGADQKWRFEIPDAPASMKEFHPGAYDAAEVMSHPDLFKAYPDMKRLSVELHQPDSMAGASGLYTPPEARGHLGLFDISETIAAQSTIPSDVRSTLLHEMQHAVQNREGFANGGSPAPFARQVREANSEIDTLNKALSAIAKDMDAAKAAGDIARASELKAVYGRVMDEKLSWVPKAQIDPMQKYRALPGEVEARNVEERQYLWPDELRAKPPWLTQDK